MDTQSAAAEGHGAPGSSLKDGSLTGMGDGLIIGLAAVGALTACPGDEPPAFDASGTWTGTAITAAENVPIRFAITDKEGSLSGQMLFGEPGSGKFLDAGDLTGSRNEADASWRVQGGNVTGAFSGNDFTGALQFVPQEGTSPIQAQLSLRR